MTKFYINYDGELLTNGSLTREEETKKMHELEDYEEYGYRMQIVELSETEFKLLNLCTQLFNETIYTILQDDKEMANAVLKDFESIFISENNFFSNNFLEIAKEAIENHRYNANTLKKFYDLQLNNLNSFLSNDKPKAKDLAKYLNVTAGAVSQYDKEKKELMLLGLWIKNLK